jgi:hypothetical protein
VDSFFLYFLRDPKCCHVAKTTQGLKGRVPKKKLVFTSFQPLQFECEFFDFFQELYKFYKSGVLSQNAMNTKNLVHSYLQI